MTDELSTKSTNAIIKFFEESGGNTSELLRGLSYERSYLTSPDNYVPAELQRTLIQRAEKLLDDPDFARKTGHYSAKPRTLGPLSVIARMFMYPEKLYQKATSMAGYFNRILTAEVEKSGPGECLMKVKASDTDKWSKEACKQTRGTLEAVPRIFGLPLARVEEETCQAPIERAGKVDGHYYAVGEDVTVTAYSDEERTQPVREVGKLNPDGSFVLGGVRYGADACRYRIKYKQRVGLWKKVKRALSRKSSYKAYVEELERMNRELEKQFDELKKHELMLSRQNEVSMALVGQTSLKEVIKLVAKHTVEVTDALVTRIFLLNEDGSITQAPGGFAVSDMKHLQFIQDKVAEFGNALPEDIDFSKHSRLEELLAKDTPNIVTYSKDLFEDYWSDDLCKWMDENSGVKNIGLVPLRSEEDNLGLIFVAAREQIEYEAIQLLANMASQAIVNARRMEQIRTQKERLEKLREIQMKTAMTRDVTSLHDYLVEKARELTGSLIVRLMLLEPGKKQIKDKHHSFDDKVLSVIQKLLADSSYFLEEMSVSEDDMLSSLLSKCPDEGITRFTGIVEIMKGLWPSDFAETIDRELGTKEVAVIPLIQNDETLGFMMFTSDHPLEDGLLQMLSAQMSQLIREAEYIRTIEEHRNQLDEKVKERTRQLEEANREIKESQSIIVQQEKMASLGQLAAGVAHELNNPLGYIQSNLHSMRDYVKDIKEYMKELDGFIENSSQSSDGNVREKASEIMDLGGKLGIESVMEDIEPLTADCLEGAERAKNIVLNLKNFSRPGESKPSPIDLTAGIESTVSVVWNEIKYRAKVHKEYDELPLIQGYPQKLNQVIMNLLVNAAHSLDKNGDIWIRTRLNDGFVEIEIEDNGRGIREEHVSRIFDPFFTTKPVGKGTGLGLSISYGIVKEHGGEILVDSRPGEGSKFTVRLPKDGMKTEPVEKEREVVK